MQNSRVVTKAGDERGGAAFRAERVRHWNRVSARRGPFSGAYHQRLVTVYQQVVPAGSSVLELGCGEGDLLAALKPSRGVGVDFSAARLERAKSRHPGLSFVQADGLSTGLNETFDVIILSDLVNDVWDVQALFEEMRRLAHPRTRLVLNTYSRLWELPLHLAQSLSLARPVLAQNWLTVEDLDNLLRLGGWELIRHWEEILWPARVPALEPLANRLLVRLAPFRLLALTNFLVARPALQAPSNPSALPIVSVIVPARNEAGNIRAIFDRTPEMGAGTELVFVEGHSRDDTFATIEREIAAHPDRNAQLLRQTGTGKGDAVRLGFERSHGDILMILDADLTVPPEDLPRFYQALENGQAEFVNGVRLVYPMEREAMRFLNLVANKFFGLSFSWLLGQRVKDTLCGTKVLWRTDYQRIARNRAAFGDFDPFGDFDLLFGAAKLNLRIVDLPIRYRERTYGTTNIQRWSHGLLLFRMLGFAARRLKFV